MREDAPTRPMSPYGTSKLMSEIMLHDVAAAFDFRYVILRYFNVAGADPQKRTGQSTPAATHLIKVGVETALGMRPSSMCLAPIIRRRTAPASATTSTSATWCARMARRWRICGAAGRGMTFNCGYGHGYSVLDVIGAIERVTGRKLPVQMVGRRPGDPASIVADVSRIHSTLDWKPQFDDLDTIVSHALAWERLLQHARNAEGHVIPA